MLSFRQLERPLGGGDNRGLGGVSGSSTQQQQTPSWLAQGGSFRGGISGSFGSSAQQPFFQQQPLPQQPSASFQQPFSSQFSHQSLSHPFSLTPQPVQPQPQFPSLTQPGSVGFGSTNPSLSLGAFPGVPARFIMAIQRGEFVNFHHLYSAIIFGSSSRPGFALVLDDHTESSSPAVSVVPKEVESRKAR